MDAWERLLDGEAEEWRLLLREEFEESNMNFVKLGRHVVNLDTVAHMIYVKDGGRKCDTPYVRIDFAGSNDHAIIDKDSEPEAYSQLMTWMDEQAPLLGD
jgi:hypothetical protein